MFKFVASFLLGLILSLNACAEGVIEPEEASVYVGKEKKVCGTVAQVVEKKGSLFVNFGGKYPNQVFHLYLTDKKKFKDLKGSVNKRVCAVGVITLYKNKPEITNPTYAGVEL